MEGDELEKFVSFYLYRRKIRQPTILYLVKNGPTLDIYGFLFQLLNLLQLSVQV